MHISREQRDTLTVRVINTTFVVLALAVFKPFSLAAWQWQAYLHLFAIGVLGVAVCIVTEGILKYIVRMPAAFDKGVEYIIRRNLRFQFINTPLISLVICLYRHFFLSSRVESNLLSWGNFFETLAIIAFCSFVIGFYWRFRFHSKYLAAELEETRMLNERLKCLNAPTHEGMDADASDTQSAKASCNQTITLNGSTSDRLTLDIRYLLYIESVGNYVKVYHLRNGKVCSDMLRATSKQMEETLNNSPEVVRCHRAFLVNLAQVEKIVSNSGAMQLIVKHTHDTLPVSRTHMSHVKAAFTKQ